MRQGTYLKFLKNSNCDMADVPGTPKSIQKTMHEEKRRQNTLKNKTRMSTPGLPKDALEYPVLCHFTHKHPVGEFCRQSREMWTRPEPRRKVQLCYGLFRRPKTR